MAHVRQSSQIPSEYGTYQRSDSEQIWKESQGQIPSDCGTFKTVEARFWPRRTRHSRALGSVFVMGPVQPLGAREKERE